MLGRILPSSELQWQLQHVLRQSVCRIFVQCVAQTGLKQSGSANVHMCCNRP